MSDDKPSIEANQKLRQEEEWPEATATVYLCEPVSPGFTSRRFKPFSFELPREVSTSSMVFYSYSVDGEPYEGKFQAAVEPELGHKFPILYNPNNPSENTGGEPLNESVLKRNLSAWLAGGAVAAFLIWLRGR